MTAHDKITTPAGAVGAARAKSNTVIRIIPIAHSQNTKTGDIPQTYTGAQTCAVRCPFRRGNGCYGESGFTKFTFARATAGEGIKAGELRQWVLDNTEAGALVRHNVCGDIARPGTSEVDIRLLKALTAAYAGRRAYSYTHCEINAHNSRALFDAMRAGFTINYSCETLSECDKALEAGIPAVLAAVRFSDLPAKTPAGHRLVQCPSQSRGISCKQCKLCAVADRKTVIVFETHGAQKRRANEAIARKCGQEA